MTTNRDTIAKLVDLVMTDGHLFGARPGTASRSLTVCGKRRIRFRLQADICNALYGSSAAWYYYPDLGIDITEAVSALRERNGAA